MEPPTLPPLGYCPNPTESMESSPRSQQTWEDPLPPIPGGAKLRLMCSFGGHIIPRPHDKSLCYVGGDTRIVVVDRHSSLSELSSRLSRTLLNCRPFSLKYQLPTEDLDSLISVSTDEDLDNMIEEYDRTLSSSPHRPSRLRLFLFFLKPETATSMGSLLDDAKSETWFVDALNSTGLLPRGLSDSATMDCLLNLDGAAVHPDRENKDSESQAAARDNINNKQAVVRSAHELHSMPDSPMVENTSSFGSSSSSPSMSNLPPIRVRVEDQNHKVAGIDEQFAQLDISSATTPPVVPMCSATTAAVCGENTNHGDHEAIGASDRSDQAVPVAFRKPPLPLQPLQHTKPAGFGAFSLPSPDSVTSDSSITSANSFSKPMLYQDPAVQANRAPVSPNTSTEIQMQQQIEEPNYALDPQQQQQQQFGHYIPHQPAPASSYYQMYPPPPQQQQQQQQFHHPMDRQYPVYVMPMAHTQSYSMNHPGAVATKGAPGGIGIGIGTPIMQVPSNGFQQQFVGYAHNPSQSIASGNANFGFEYAHEQQQQPVYYTQSQAAVAAPLPPQYQTMTPATIAALTDTAKQMIMPTDHSVHPL